VVPYNNPIMYAEYTATTTATQAVNNQARPAGTVGASGGRGRCGNNAEATS